MIPIVVDNNIFFLQNIFTLCSSSSMYFLKILLDYSFENVDTDDGEMHL